MPELPEVETIRRDLVKLIVGRKILDVTTDTPKKVLPSVEEVKTSIVGSEIKKIARRAKILQLFLSNGKILLFHLKMTGRLLFRDAKDQKDDWQHTVIKLSGDKELRFADSRKFGWLKLVTPDDLRQILLGYGPEPLADLTLARFKTILKTSRRPIKLVLTDQEKISGIGNIYANEALFMAKVDPKTPSNQITDKCAAQLFEAVEKVLTKGLFFRGASDQYYVDAYGQKGHYQEHFLVYQRQGEKCPDCPGTIERILLGGRGTFYCPSCQKPDQLCF